MADAWRTAAEACVAAAEATASLTPKIGRARPLAERSIGTPDPGAISLGLIATAIGQVVAGDSSATDFERGRKMTMGNKVRLLVGSDSAGFDYKDAILADMKSDDRVESVEDLGVYAGKLEDGSYPSVAIAAGTKISAGEADRAILVCGTGIGVAIAANKVPGIRATVAHDSFSVERSILSNDCQVLTLGQRVIGLQLARRLAKEWLGYVFDPSSPSNAKVAEIIEYEDMITG